ncbi:MAG: ArnT family glycosyltransferase [Gemmatimonadota bacterium]
MRDPAGTGRQGAILGAALAVVAIAAGLPGLAEVGVTWDEPRYFQSVERIQEWAVRVASGEWRAALSAEAIEAAWDADRYYNPHPPAYKAAMAVTDAAFGDLLGVPASYRLSSLLMFALLVALVTSWTARVTRPAAGAAAGLSLLLMPRALGHAHVAATDTPLTLLWFVATMGAFFYVRDGRRRWIVIAALALGLGLATKFTAFLLPVPLAVWMLLQARTRRSVVVCLYGLALAMLISVLVNPAAWPDPLGYQRRLVAESLSRETYVPISTYYAGRSFLFAVPWHHAIVMTVATVPVATLALAALSLKAVIRPGGTRRLATLCVVQVAFWWGLMALPDSPNHDGVRLWLPMFPFVAVMVGIGFGILVGALKRWFEALRVSPGELAAPLLLGALYFAPSLLGTLGARPYYLSYYAEAVGGASGAAEHGLEATYWFDAFTASFRDEVERVLPPGARVVAHPNAEYYTQLQDLGLLRDDIRFTEAPPADYLLLLGRKAMLERGWEVVYREARPLLAAELDGVELIGLYRWSDREAEAADTVTGETP